MNKRLLMMLLCCFITVLCFGCDDGDDGNEGNSDADSDTDSDSDSDSDADSDSDSDFPGDCIAAVEFDADGVTENICADVEYILRQS